MQSATLLPLLAVTTAGFADDLVVLHDNGEPDGINGYSNQTSGVFGHRRTLLDDFVVPEHETWSLQAVRWLHVSGTAGNPVLPTGLLLMFRHDESGIPGAVFTSEIEITEIISDWTGRVFFSREEIVSWVTFDPVELPAGHYWFEAAIAHNEDNFWLTASPIQHSECWVNYEDLGGFMSGTGQFGAASDLAWRLEGARSGCPGDLDESGAVDLADLLLVLGAWGQSGGPEDLDGSGLVDFADLLFVLGAWGVCG